MKQSSKVSVAVIRRLPRYIRVLDQLRNEGIKKISSSDLSERIGYTASQIRQDLNHFGGFGQQGYGYNVDDLYNKISEIMGLNGQYKLVVAGCGKLGQAISRYTYDFEENFKIAGLFDIKEELIGTEIVGVKVRDISKLTDFVRDNGIDIGIMTLPADQAPAVAKALADGGVGGIWNFAPIDLEPIDGVPVENVHIWDSLEVLAYNMKHGSSSGE